MKQKAIVLDIDGVIFDSIFLLREIHDSALKGDEMWEYYYNNCNSDRVKVNKFIYNLLQGYKQHAFLISTSRSEKCRKETEDKLFKEGLFPQRIYMRPEGDLRLAPELKQSHLEEIQKEFDVELFIDDEPANCRMARELGIFTIRVIP